MTIVVNEQFEELNNKPNGSLKELNKSSALVHLLKEHLHYSTDKY